MAPTHTCRAGWAQPDPEGGWGPRGCGGPCSLPSQYGQKNQDNWGAGPESPTPPWKELKGLVQVRQAGKGHEALQAPAPPEPFLQLEAISFPKITAPSPPGDTAGTGAQGLPSTPRTFPPISCCVPCLGTPAGGPWLLASSLGAALGPGGQREGLEAQTFCGSSSLMGQQNSGWGGRLCLPFAPVTTQQLWSWGWGGGKRKPQHPAFHPRPQLLCICLFTLEKAPRPRQEMGQFQEARPDWGTRSHIVLHARLLPTLGLPREPGEGDLRGGPAGRRRGARGCQRSEPAVHERASVRGRDWGLPRPHPSWE